MINRCTCVDDTHCPNNRVNLNDGTGQHHSAWFQDGGLRDAGEWAYDGNELKSGSERFFAHSLSYLVVTDCDDGARDTAFKPARRTALTLDRDTTNVAPSRFAEAG
ncbi:MAG TPA: hypothetical protein VJU53_10060 [Burkholderiaceae bacterium]|nr:hypothetical protein [Burkholderiaceae bacterium]